MAMLSRRVRLPHLVSVKVEESIRLRAIALLVLWVAALSVAWVGGSPWAWLGGGIAATAGHAFSWKRRHRKMGVWTAIMAVPLVVLALVMRADILAALDGNWLPLAHSCFWSRPSPASTNAHGPGSTRAYLSAEPSCSSPASRPSTLASAYSCSSTPDS